MKNNKKLIGLIVGLVCLIVCLVLVLTMCNGGSNDDPTQPSETVDTTDTTGATDESTASTEGTTTPSEETTAPTEETTGGNSTPGGSGGYNPGVSTQPTTPSETPEATEPAVEVAEPGTETNAYTESVTKLPGSFTTVKIPAKGTMYYTLYTTGAFLTIEDADAVVTMGDKTYAPADGVISVALPGTEEPISLQIANKAAEEKAFTVNVKGAVGSESNPEVLASVSQIETKLEAGDQDGYFYAWTAEQAGLLMLGFDSIQPETVGADMAITLGEETVRLSDSEDGFLWAFVAEGDQVIIQIVATPDAEGNYPATEIAASSLFVPNYDVNVEQLPWTVETVNVAAGDAVIYTLTGVANSKISIYDETAFVICNGVTYGPDDFGAIHVPVGESDTAQLIIGNIGETEKAYVLEIVSAEADGPAEVMVGEKNTASFGENDDNYCYTWTAYQDGTLKLTMDFDNYSGWYMLVNNVTTGETVGEINSDGFDNYICVDVKANDVLEVQVNTHAYDSVITPAGDVSFDASFVSGSGTEEDPYSILGTDVNISVGAGETVYATGRFSGMIADVYGENVTIANNGNSAVSEWGFASLEITGGDMWTPPVFTLTNTGDAATYNLVFTYPLGSSANPEEMAVGATNTAILEANDEDGYYFQHTAYVDGTLKITMDPENETEWFFTVENRTQGYFGDWHYSDSDPYITSESIAVKAGDTIIVQVNTYNSLDMFDLPAGEVSFDVSFVSGNGTEEEPYEILGLDVDISVGAGETVYCTGRLSSMIANVYGENVTIANEGNSAAAEWGVAIMEITGGDMWTPSVFTLTNTGEEDAAYNVLFTYPIGSSENPAELIVGEKHTASLEANDMDGYYYQFVAYLDGSLTIAMDPANETGWFFTVENQTQGIFGDWHYSDDDPYVNSETVAVTAGDVIVIQVNTYDPLNMWESPAGDVSFNASFISGSGTEEDPYQLQGLDADISVGANETVYYTGRYSGMILNLTGDNATISCNGITASSSGGTASCLISGGDMWTPPVFTITNSGEAANYHISFTYPLGSMDNPDTLEIGNDSVSFVEASSEYYLVWKASAAGTLTVTIDDTNTVGWQFAVSNLTDYYYGDSHVSADNPLVSSETITVNAGDEVQLRICTFDPNNPWAPPAGEVSYTVTFTPAE